jgi:predicted amidohydrolase
LGAEIVSFHEACVQGYSWIQALNKEELLDVAESVPNGPAVRELIDVAREFRVVVMAGLLERHDGNVYNCYVTVGPDGFITRFRKLHPFVNPHLSPGDGYNVIDLLGCKIGFLICYDNNLPENVRITAMLGAEIIFMPHVTGCLPSPMPGRGVVDRSFWDNRHRDPVALRQEFQGPKGREWLMRWLPARAFENGVYAIFSNPIGWDYDTVKPGLAMILDPFGEVLAESSALDDDVVVELLTPEKLEISSGRRYLKARRPELYDKLVEPQESVTLPGWQLEHQK